ncbi:MAG: hypothetical protein HJJLKODD_01888 [Phycisphaerae bacterium]|nr:hypothetical protein [Phycisphaerae bacterium]
MGDGRTVASYGFDLSNLQVATDYLVAAGFPKDGLPVLDDPPVITAAQADELNKEHRKFLVSSDRVIGVVINGQARAYPLRLLCWHELVNDTLADQPIAVTYSPLCDSVMVFDRRVTGRTLRFGVSGLLYNSNLLIYDRAAGGENPLAGARGADDTDHMTPDLTPSSTADSAESLWSQLLGRAVAGPAAGTKLAQLPAQLVHWSSWKKQYPDTTVLAPQPQFQKRYQLEPYNTYYDRGRLRFPVAPLPTDPAIPLMTPAVLIRHGQQKQLWTIPEIARQCAGNNIWSTAFNNQPLIFHYQSEPDSVFVELPLESPLQIIHCFYFAGYTLLHEK